MPALLAPLELYRLTQEGGGDRLGVAEHALASFSFGLYRDVPDRQTDQPLARFGLEHRPIDDGRLVAVMGVEQHPAKRRLVRLATGNYRSGFCCSPHPGSTIGSLDRRVIQHRRHSLPEHLRHATFAANALVERIGRPGHSMPRTCRVVDLADRLPYIAASARER